MNLKNPIKSQLLKNDDTSDGNNIPSQEDFSFQKDQPLDQQPLLPSDKNSCMNIEIPNTLTSKEQRRQAKKEAKREAKKQKLFQEKLQLRRQVIKVNLQKCGLTLEEINDNCLTNLSDEVLGRDTLQEFMMRIQNEKDRLLMVDGQQQVIEHMNQDVTADDLQMEEHEISQRREDFIEAVDNVTDLDKNGTQKMMLGQTDRDEIQRAIIQSQVEDELCNQLESVQGTVLSKNLDKVNQSAQKKSMSMLGSRINRKNRAKQLWGNFFDEEKQPTVQKPSNKDFAGVSVSEMGKMLSNKKSSKQTLSYRKLNKMIVDNHPTDPDTGKQFLPWQSVTVSGFNFKLADSLCCGCMQLKELCENLKIYFHQYVYGKNKKKIQRPETLDDEPSSEDELKDTYRGLANPAIHLGEGAVLYLQMMKTFAILFFVLSVINIPVFMLYSSLSPGGDSASVGQYEEASFYSHFMIGNLGLTTVLCGNSFVDFATSESIYTKGPFPPQYIDDDGNLKDVIPKTLQSPNMKFYENGVEPQQMSFQCPGGYVSEMIEFGFLYLLDHERNHFSRGAQICNEIRTYPKTLEEASMSLPTKALFDQMIMAPEFQPNITENNIDSNCNSETMFRSKEMKNKFQQFKEQKCMYKQECSIDFENMVIDIDKEQSLTEQLKLSEMISLECYDRIFNKQITSMEFVAILGCRVEDLKIPFTNDLFFQKKYAGLVAVFMDFICILISLQFYRKLHDLNEEYCEIIDGNDIKMSNFTIRIDNFRLDKSTQDVRMLKMKLWLHFTQILNMEKYKNINQVPEGIEGRNVDRHEVSDVQFSCLSNQMKYKILFMMQKYEQKIEELKEKMNSRLTDAKDVAIFKKELKKNKDQLEKYQKRYETEIAKESKNRAVTVVPKIDFINSVDYIWVTFKDSESNKKAIELFKKKGSVALLATKMLQDPKNINEELLLEGQELNVIKETIQPDQYIWQNLQHSFKEIRRRSQLFVLLTIATAVVSLMISLVFSSLQEQLGIDIDCAQVESSATDALDQQLRLDIQLEAIGMQTEEDEEIALSDGMVCYCKDITKNGMEPWQATIDEFLSLRPELDENDIPNYCQQYMLLEYKKKALINMNDYYILLINSFVAAIFEMVGGFQRKHNTLNQRKQTFWQIFILEFFNMSGVYFLLAFDANGLSKQFLNTEYDAKGYQDFESRWYADNGTRLCITIFLGTITSNIPEITMFFKVQKARFQDRGWTTLNIKKDLDDVEDDAPNTKQVTQKYLEDLYMGEEFSGEKQFSRMMSILLVCMSYSSGMPILYVGGFFYFGLTYIVNKVMLFQYYKKTTTLDRTLPLYTMTFLKYCIFIHMFVGVLMFSNTQVLKYKSLIEEQGGSSDEEKPWGSRFLYLHCTIQLIVFGIAMMVYIVYKFGMGIVRAIQKPLQKKLDNLLQMIKAKLKKKNRTEQVEVVPIQNTNQDSVMKPNQDSQNKSDKNDSQQQESLNHREADSEEMMRESTPQPRSSVVHPEHLLSVLRNHGIEEADISKETSSHNGSDQAGIDSQEERRLSIIRKEFYEKVVHPDFSDNIYMEINIKNLVNTYQRAVKDLDDIRLYFNINDQTILKVLKPHTNKNKKKPKLRVIFEEICYICNLTFDEVTQYLDMLQKRVSDIEDVINRHFDLIRDTIINTKRDLVKKKMVEQALTKERKARGQSIEYISGSRNKKDTKRVTELLESQGRFEEMEEKLQLDPELDFSQYSIFDKLECLERFEDELIQSNKNQEENRRGNKTICRMTGSQAQSYFIIDQKEYGTANQLYYEFQNIVGAQEEEQANFNDAKSVKSNKTKRSNANNSPVQK